MHECNWAAKVNKQFIATKESGETPAEASKRKLALQLKSTALVKRKIGLGQEHGTCSKPPKRRRVKAMQGAFQVNNMWHPFYIFLVMLLLGAGAPAMLRNGRKFSQCLSSSHTFYIQIVSDINYLQKI